MQLQDPISRRQDIPVVPVVRYKTIMKFSVLEKEPYVALKVYLVFLKHLVTLFVGVVTLIFDNL